MVMVEKQRCVILVPHTGVIEPECEKSLVELEERRFEVRRRSLGTIDFARSIMASDAVRDGFEQVMWIDSDIGFDPDDVLKLSAQPLPVCSGIYPKKGGRAIASNLLPGSAQVVFGREGGVIEIAYAAAGFLCIHRDVFLALQETLPLCNETFDAPFHPFFMPMVGSDKGKPWYLGEDFAFCERARRAGFKIYADTSIRLHHYGRYAYSWEDAGGVLPRHETYFFNVVPPPGADPVDSTAAQAAP
jgi:hypothetical protein